MVRFPLWALVVACIGSSMALGAPDQAAVESFETSAPDDAYILTDHYNDPGDYSNIDFLDWSQEKASEYVEALNDRVDSFFMGAFFDDEMIEDESSGSNGRIFFSSRREDGLEPNYKVGLNLHLVLPKTRDRFKLLLETDEEEDGLNETNVLNTPDNVTYSTALRIEVDKGRNWNTSFDNGIRWAGEPVYFSRVRARRTDYFEQWRTRVLQTISWRTDEHWGSNFSTNAIRPIDVESHIRLGFIADYLLDDDYANLESSFSIFHEVNSRSGLLYSLEFLGDTEDAIELNETVLSISYRRKLLARYLFVEIVPELAWPEENNFEVTPAITVLFEMILGVDE